MSLDFPSTSDDSFTESFFKMVEVIKRILLLFLAGDRIQIVQYVGRANTISGFKIKDT